VQYPNIFDGIGVLPFTYSIKLKDNARPVVHAPRRIPVPLRQDLRKELDRMVALNVIQPTKGATEWVNSMVCVRKPNGALRICMDPKDLNENILREQYQIPKREEILSEMAGAKWFTKLDASHGFWQLQIDSTSADLCTFNTPFGRYSYQRLPFGISSAPEIFHCAMENVFEGLEGVRVYIDDVIIWAETQEQLNSRVHSALQRVHKYGLRLNKEKCQFSTQEVTFLGDRLTPAGVQPDMNKIKAVTDMPEPTDKKAVQRALGMVNCMGRFVPNLAAKTVALRQLLQSNTEWSWHQTHDKEWKEIKDILSTEPVLVFFDPSKKTRISTDASKDGLGAVLLQCHDGAWKPVAYAARSMTETEQRYAQIEKECLGLVFGCDKFHSYVFGLPHIELETDHKPLITISKKHLNEMTPRIQRMMMRLQKYTYELSYKPGKYLVVADALSRARPAQGLNTDGTEEDEDIRGHVDAVVEALPVSSTLKEKIVMEMESDMAHAK